MFLNKTFYFNIYSIRIVQTLVKTVKGKIAKSPLYLRIKHKNIIQNPG